MSKAGNKAHLMVWSLLAALAFAEFAMAQQAPPIEVRPIHGGVYYVVGGAGSDTGFIVGKDGVIVIDAKMTVPSAKEMIADIAKITPKPITTVILTHSDGDHVNGLAGFPDGLTIIAQENCKKEMEESLATKNPAPKDRLPTKTVANEENITINGVKLTLLHFAPAHTSGDLMVYLPEQKIVFTGDIIATSQEYTLIHTNKHGSSEGWITTVRGLLALDANDYVPGHGDLQTKADVQQRLDRTIARRDQIMKLMAQGKTVEEAKAAMGEVDKPAAPGQPQFPSFTNQLYDELGKKN
jgi:glyoxylase-like metal-dependent hydrolase (beta-lactamase superfamily II)